MTFFETAGQSRVFLLLLYAGAAAAGCFDLVSILRKRSPPIIAALLDFLWCLLAAGLCLLALAAGEENRLRLYALLGMLCGGGIYCLGPRSALRWLVRRVKKSGPPTPK